MINLHFTYKKQSVNKLMLWVVIAAIPGVICQIYFFGSGTIYQILLAIITAFICETIALQLRELPVVAHLKDNSALVTALLLAVSIPPLSPWWLVVLGTVFAILIAKHIYGGLGQNIFNPAMVGYVVLVILFPVQMTNWLKQMELQSIYIDALDSLQVIFTYHTDESAALDKLILGFNGKTHSTSFSQILQQPILQNSLASISWQLVNIAYLFGGIIMLNRQIISWQIPFAFLATLMFCSLLSWLMIPLQYVSPMKHLFSGETMLGAFFIATDPVTAAVTPRGRLIYGAIIGLLIWIIRVYGGYPDAVSFAVLIANMSVPFIDQYSQPRVYGHK